MKVHTGRAWVFSHPRQCCADWPDAASLGWACVVLSLRYNATTKSQSRITMSPFGNYVRSKREQAGITLTEFAKRLDISPAYWSRIETGRENPPKDELIKEAARILSVTEDELFIEANRFPPDMQQDVAEAVRLYRKQHKNT
jgi:ribosome-binding protein aMBF1 (putative translation factor)